MLLKGSLKHDTSGRKKSTSRPRGEVFTKLPDLGFRDLGASTAYRRATPVYRSVPDNGYARTADTSYKVEESKKFTVAPAYNKSGYQVISEENIKDIGR
jgi:hypothetical protein